MTPVQYLVTGEPLGGTVNFTIPESTRRLIWNAGVGALITLDLDPTLAANLIASGSLQVYTGPPGQYLTQIADGAGGYSYGTPSNRSGIVTRPPSIQLVDKLFMGQSGHPFTTAGTGSTGNSNDTTDFVLGTRAIKVTTNGAGANTNIHGTFSGALDLTGKCLVAWVKQENLSKYLGGYPRLWLGDTNLTNAYYWRIDSSATQPWALDGEWVRITLPFGTATAVGSPSRASLAALTIQIFDNNTSSPVTVHLGGLATMAEQTKFSTGVVTFCFDDGLISQYTTAKPILDAVGASATLFSITETIWNHANYGGYMDLPTVTSLQNQSDWDVASHAYTANGHNNFPTLTAAQQYQDMLQTREWLRANGFYAADLYAYPEGFFSTDALAAAAQAGFSACRVLAGVGGVPDETWPPANVNRLRTLSLNNAVSIATAEAAVDRAATGKEWLIFTLHDVLAAAGSLAWATADFQTLVNYCVAKPIPIRKLSDVLRT